MSPRHPATAIRAAISSCLLAVAMTATAQRPAREGQVEPAEPLESTTTFAPRCPGRAVLVTRAGDLLVTERGFETEAGRVRYHNASGTLVAVRLSEIDVAATEDGERRRCPSPVVELAPSQADATRPRGSDPVAEVIDALVELGVSRARLEALATDRTALRSAVDAVVAVATDLERQTREIELTYRLDTVGGMVAAAPAYREVAASARAAATRQSDPRIAAVIGDLAVAFDEVARMASEEPERAIEEFDRQSSDRSPP